MNPRPRLFRSLYHYRRTHVGVLLATALCTAVLSGALLTNSSVERTLQLTASMGLGTTEFALASPDRLLGVGTAMAMESRLERRTAGLLSLRGSAGFGQDRVHDIHVIGATPDFFSLSPSGSPVAEPADGTIYLNEKLSRSLGAAVGDEVVLRIHNPQAMPIDAPLSTAEGSSVAVRVRVAKVLGADEFGNFNLRISQIPPMNVFIGYGFLSSLLGLDGRINTILVGGGGDKNSDLGVVESTFSEVFPAVDAGLYARPYAGGTEVLSDRIFIDPAIEELGGDALLTYFADRIVYKPKSGGEKDIPYSFVTALDQPGISSGLGNDGIVLNRWAASDLGAAPGDIITLEYRILNEEGELRPESRSFVLRNVIAIETDHRLFVPEYPGIAGVDNCSDWEPGFSIDVRRIRDKDEAYWDEYGGSPKAFVSRSAGIQMWGNVYGNSTALRFPSGTIDGPPLGFIGDRIDPKSLGLSFTAVMADRQGATGGGVDFGQLFIGLSMFLVCAAVILTGLFFSLSFQARSSELGLLTALGVPRSRILRSLLGEHGVIGIVGSVLGLGFGVAYNKLLLYGLETVWNDAVRLERIVQHVSAKTVVPSILSGFAISLVVGYVGMRRRLRDSPVRLLEGVRAPAFGPGTRGNRRVLFFAAVAAVIAVGVVISGIFGKATSRSALFLVSGMLLLVSGTAFFSVWMERSEGRTRWPKGSGLSISKLGFKNATRRRTRSLTTAVLFAAGILIITAVGANRGGTLSNLSERGSGTGGFLLLGEAAVPVREFPYSVSAVPFKVLEGDDASCLNLNRVSKPRLLGVDPALLSGRFSFDTIPAGKADPWSLLEEELGDGIIAGVADQTVLTWGLGINVGDELVYQDDSGDVLRVRLVASLENSIFQGSVIVSRRNIARHFPSVSGSRFFLIDGTRGEEGVVAESLERQTRPYGIDFVSTAERLGEYYSVENTYLTIFMMLGGLGILLGAFGLGVAAARNVYENRGELGLLLAVGYRLASVRRLIFTEHLVPLIGGAGIGVVSALVSVLPALISNNGLPIGFLSVTIAAIVFSGAGSIMLAVRRIHTGGLLSALREE